jgi:hypothetical protein
VGVVSRFLETLEQLPDVVVVFLEQRDGVHFRPPSTLPAGRPWFVPTAGRCKRRGGS